MTGIKIFHIADVHLGMRFSRYPGDVSDRLYESRFKALENAVKIANSQECDYLSVGGDLFESIKVKQKEVVRAVEILSQFTGAYVWVLPGNHDYYDETLKLWQWFNEIASDKIVVLASSKKYTFEYGASKIEVFAAPCNSKHSSVNNLQWVKERQIEADEAGIKVLMAHGAIKDISPDLNNTYFPMTLKELTDLNMDFCLMGHTHVPYPVLELTSTETIFNPGTIEPDGLNYPYDGYGWLIEVGVQYKVTGKKIRTGNLKFRDVELSLDGDLSADTLMKPFNDLDLMSTIARIRLKGRVNQDAYQSRFKVLDALSKEFLYFEGRDDALKPKFDRAFIESAFSENSVPNLLLNLLLEEADEETAHLAYELMQEGLSDD